MKKWIASSIVQTAMGGFVLLAFTNTANASEQTKFVKNEEQKKKKKKGCGCGGYEMSLKLPKTVS